jgi:CubicO group peptidase (beta-lactamase class C family)
MKSIFVLLLIASTAQAITKAQVERIVVPATQVAHLDSVAVGVIDRDGRAVYGFGKHPPDGKTIFEIGSITKVFTATLLADAVERGEVQLETRLTESLPADVKLTSKDAAQITLLQLATHTSGLERLPPNLNYADPFNPYVDYDAKLLHEALSAATPLHKPGEKYDYSNFAMGTLGYVLARKSGKTYEQLLTDRICTPLKMGDTRITLDHRLRARLAQGHDIAGFPMKNWDFDALAGAGAIRSTAADMLTFLAANMELDPPADAKLRAAMKLCHERRTKTDEKGADIALGWHIGTRTGTRWHDGGTGGYSSFAGFIPDKTAGVVVLCNTQSGMVNTISVQLIRAMLGEEVEPIQPTTSPTQ